MAHFIHLFHCPPHYTPPIPLIPIQSSILSHNLICLKPIISADGHKHRDDDCHLSRCIRLWRDSNVKSWSSPLKLHRYKYISFLFHRSVGQRSPQTGTWRDILLCWSHFVYLTAISLFSFTARGIQSHPHAELSTSRRRRGSQAI